MSDRKLETLHNGKLHNLYSLPSIISMIRKRRIRLAGNVARMGKDCIYGGKVRMKKIPLGRPITRWEDNIRKYLRGTGCDSMD
jgi:hypothetical protein